MSRNGWMTYEEAARLTPATIVSVGYVIEVNAFSVVLAQTKDADDRDAVADTVAIYPDSISSFEVIPD